MPGFTEEEKAVLETIFGKGTEVRIQDANADVIQKLADCLDKLNAAYAEIESLKKSQQALMLSHQKQMKDSALKLKASEAEVLKLKKEAQSGKSSVATPPSKTNSPSAEYDFFGVSFSKKPAEKEEDSCIGSFLFCPPR